MKARLLSKTDNTELAHAETWDMSWFGRDDGRSRIGLIDVEVAAAHRRKGFGRFLVSEILRRARENLVGLVEVQTASTNAAAISLIRALGFQPIEESTFYRLPAQMYGRAGRS